MSHPEKTAVVVGATGNLGGAVCAELKAKGFAIDPVWASADRPDATKASSYERLPDRIDVAVYLAGINVVKPITDLAEDEWDRVFDINVKGAFHFARAAFPRLKKGHSPLFLCISSIMVTHPYPGRSAYASAKAALEGFTRALAVEWGPHGIATHCIRLGHLSGLMKTTPANPALLEAVKGATPNHRLIDPTEVASYTGWLATGGAHAVNGSVVDFDPAYTINRWPLR